MSSKLYVGNLSFRLEEGQLETVFGECGEVKSVKIITDRETGRSRGFGFVEMGSEDEAKAAMEKFDGLELEGRNLRVSIAHDKGGQGNRGGGRNFNRR